MTWKPLTDTAQIDAIDTASMAAPQVVFKHSTTCGISAVAHEQMQRLTPEGDVGLWYVDLLAYRGVSDEIAQRYGVRHESPQVLVIRNGQCTANVSHWEVTVEGVRALVSLV